MFCLLTHRELVVRVVLCLLGIEYQRGEDHDAEYEEKDLQNIQEITKMLSFLHNGKCTPKASTPWPTRGMCG
jgi:hypothetical protein